MDTWHEQGGNIARAKPSLAAPSLGSSTRSKRHTLQASNAAMKFHGGAWRQTESPPAMYDPAACPGLPSSASHGKPGASASASGAQRPVTSSPPITPEPGEKRPRSVASAAHATASHGSATGSSPENSQAEEDAFDLAEPSDGHDSAQARVPSAHAGHAHAAAPDAAGMDVHARTQEALDALQRKEEQKLHALRMQYDADCDHVQAEFAAARQRLQEVLGMAL